MILLFAFTLFLSSMLLFVVQPMIAKMVLPMLGGTPAVWNTCMVFFQAMLLAGYLYVHAATKWLKTGQQALLHITLLGASLLTFPIALAAAAGPPASGMPVLWLLRVLALTIGVPFFIVSTTSPLLQRFFARTGHPSSRDPYFLSVAGNLGSVVALAAYPAAVEPTLRLANQSWLWTTGYAVLVMLIIACYWVAYLNARPSIAEEDNREPTISREDLDHAGQVSWPQRLRWVALAFVPSSLMLGVTTYLTTDVAAVPLFWIVPLTIYLLTLVLVFSRRVILPHAAMVHVLPLFALVLATVIGFASHLPPIIQGPIHLGTFFVAAMVCHGELARVRPASRHLTDFYLSMSLGGVLGGIFNALVAPLAFRTVVEYPLAIVLACAARPMAARLKANGAGRYADLLVPAAFGVLVLGMLFAFGNRGARDPLMAATRFVVPAVICFSFKRRPIRFALSLAALMVASSVYMSARQQVTYRGRSFFGVHHVADDPNLRLRFLIHGRINHGAQSLDPARRREPLTYFHRTGPIGQAFATFRGAWAKPRVGVIGLGIGTLAAYGEPGQHWTFYEIDPTIVSLARDTRYFTYLSDSATEVRIVLGDGRLALNKEQPGVFDLLIADAFSSDAIPVHLMTREALRVYQKTLDTHGILAFQISNRYIDFQPLLGDLAHDAGLVALAQEDIYVTEDEERAGKSPSSWVLMARSPDDLGTLAHDPRWHTLSARERPVVWTDDFSNPVALFKWFK